MTDELDDMGSIDYVVVEFPGDRMTQVYSAESRLPPR